MDALTAARRIAQEHGFADCFSDHAPEGVVCVVDCNFTRTHQGVGPVKDTHAPDCPWLALPAIVAALEAAQAVVDAYSPQRARADVMLKLEAALAGGDSI